MNNIVPQVYITCKHFYYRVKNHYNDKFSRQSARCSLFVDVIEGFEQRAWSPLSDTNTQNRVIRSMTLLSAPLCPKVHKTLRCEGLALARGGLDKSNSRLSLICRILNRPLIVHRSRLFTVQFSRNGGTPRWRCLTISGFIYLSRRIIVQNRTPFVPFRKRRNVF